MNLRIDPQIVWFPLPMLILAFAILRGIEGKSTSSPIVISWRNPRLLTQVSALSLVVILLGLTLNGWHRMLDGGVTVHGDGKEAPELFKTAFSVVVVVAGAFVEEATVRGMFQLRTKQVIGDTFSQLGGLIIFLVLHGTAVIEFKRLLFLIVLGAFLGISHQGRDLFWYQRCFMRL